MKIHLKRAAKDHLTLCQKWEDNWVLREAAEKQKTGTVCKICEVVAEESPKRGRIVPEDLKRN